MAATRPVVLRPFPQGYGEVPRPISNQVMAVSLAASVAESFTPPAGSSYVVFSGNVDFFVNAHATATVPGDVTDGTASELNPSGYSFHKSELPTFSVISASAGIVTAAFYS